VFALAFGVRLVVALSRSDELELELYTGTFGWSLLQGLPLDPARLPIIDHLRGSVLFGALVVPFQWLLGPQLLALKLLACTWGATHVLLLAWLSERVLGRFAAAAAAALLILAPPSYQMVGVLALGSHEAIGLWIALGLFVLCARPAGGAGAPAAALSAARCLAFGAVCGCGVLFSLQYVVALPALALAWLALDPRFPLRPRSWLCCVGAAPLLALIPLLSTQGKLVASKPEDHVQFSDLGAIATKFGELVPLGIRRSWLYEEQGGAWLSWVVGACLLVALVSVLQRAWRRDALALYALAHPLVYAFAHALTDFELNFDNTLDGIGSRYLMPLWPCFALWIAIAAREGRAGPWIPLGWALALAPALAGLLGVVALSDPLQVFREPTPRGLDYGGFTWHLRRASRGDLGLKLELLERCDPDWSASRPLVLEAGRFNAPYTEPLLGDLVREAQNFAPLARACRLVEIGGWLTEANDPQRLATPTCLAIPAADRAWLLRGVGRELLQLAGYEWIQFRRLPDNYANFLRELSPEDRRIAAEGGGFFAGLKVTPYNPPGLDMLTQGLALGPLARPSFFRAAGLGFRVRYFEADYFVPPEGVLRIERVLPADARAWFREGLRLPLDGAFDPQAEPTLPVRE
jgi:hypothetical protein